MKLKKESIKWAITHLDKENDTDVFPKPPEISIIKQNENNIVEELSKTDIGNYKWNLSRKLLVAKDELSHRVITQLDPIDSIYLGAIIKEFGHLIENNRISESEEVVFGNRFAPTEKGLLYKSDGQWKKFWNKNKALISEYQYAVRFDIADFYNQIYHHSIENALIKCNFQNQVKKSIKSFLSTLTFNISRSIPVGPHSTHLLAEAVLINIDESLKSNGITYTRYMDDFIAFSNSELECRIILNKVASILDKQQKLILQRHKTKIFDKIDFLIECDNHLLFEPLSAIEEEISSIIQDYSEDNPYGNKIDWDDLDEDDKQVILNIGFKEYIDRYLNKGLPDYSKLRWVYRMLKQLGAPQAIEYSIENMDKLTPVINDVCAYFISSAPNYNGNIRNIGKEIHEILNSELIQSNEYLQISLMNLFVKNLELNHFEIFANKFDSSSENIKREIILVAGASKKAAWLRELKDHYNQFGPWSKRSLLIAYACLPSDERKFFYSSMKELGEDELIQKIIMKWGNKYNPDENLPF